MRHLRISTTAMIKANTPTPPPPPAAPAMMPTFEDEPLAAEGEDVVGAGPGLEGTGVVGVTADGEDVVGVGLVVTCGLDMTVTPPADCPRCRRVDHCSAAKDVGGPRAGTHIRKLACRHCIV